MTKAVFYATSPYANSAHLFLYLIYSKFETEILFSEKSYRNDYMTVFDVSGNVAKMAISAKDSDLVDRFVDIITKSRRFTDEEIRVALEQLSLKTSRKVRLKDLNAIKTALRDIAISSERPVVTDDSLSSPGYDLCGERKTCADRRRLREDSAKLGVSVARVLSHENPNFLTFFEDNALVFISDPSEKIDFDGLIRRAVEKILQ